MAPRPVLAILTQADLQDAPDWIADQGLHDKFAAMKDFEVYIVQLQRDSVEMRNALMLAKMRFR
jgi:hypothetical protein